MIATDNEIQLIKEIIFMDIIKNAAIVKCRVVAGCLIFIDYITLMKTNGQWLIRNKSFTTLPY